MPNGSSYTPGRLQSPDTDSTLVPGLPLEPIWANQPGPWSRMRAAQQNVSTLLTTDGMPR